MENSSFGTPNTASNPEAQMIPAVETGQGYLQAAQQEAAERIEDYEYNSNILVGRLETARQEFIDSISIELFETFSSVLHSIKQELSANNEHSIYEISTLAFDRAANDPRVLQAAGEEDMMYIQDYVDQVHHFHDQVLDAANRYLDLGSIYTENTSANSLTSPVDRLEQALSE